MKTLVLLFCFYVLSINLYSQEQGFRGSPYSQNFYTDTYNAGTQNWGIAQGQNGMLYFANHFGLLGFDGADWELYPLSIGSMKAVSIDQNGRIYIGAQQEFGYCEYNEEGRLSYTSLAKPIREKGISFDEIWNVYTDNDGAWFCSHRYLFRFDGDSVVVHDPEEEIKYSYVIGNTIFVNSTESGLLTFKDGSFSLARGGGFFKQKEIRSILPVSNSEWLIATLSDGLFIYNGEEAIPWADEQTEVLFHEVLVNVVVRLRNGNYAIGTQNNGLYIFSWDGKLITHINKKKGLANQSVFALLEDKVGNLWVALNNGISYVEISSPFEHIGETYGVQGVGYAALRDGDIEYIGTSNGLYYRDLSAAEWQFKLVEGSEGQVWSIKKIDKTLFLGHHRGAFEIKNGRARQVSSRPGAWMFQKVKGKEDFVLQGYYNGFILYRFKNGRWKEWKKLEGFDESSRLFWQKDNEIWVSHGFKGVYRVQLTAEKDSIVKVDYYNSKHGFPSDRLINMFVVQNQAIFGAEKGVYRFDKTSERFVLDQRWMKYFTADERLIELEETPGGDLYFVSSNKIGVLKKTRFNTFELNTGLFKMIAPNISDDLENVTCIDYNTNLIGAKEGMISFNPNSLNAKRDKPTVLLREVIAGFSDFDQFSLSVRVKKKVEVPFDQNRIYLRFACPFYEGLNENQYSYMLQNYDKVWSNWSSINFKEYANLNPGNYIFYLKSKNVFGEESEVLEYHFEILPPLYRTPAAYFVYAILILAGLSILVFSQKLQHEREKAELEQKQQEELTRRDVEVKQISRQADEEIERLKHEKLEAQIEFKNRELTNTTMHLVTKNEFLSGLKKQMEKIIDVDERRKLNAELRRMMKEIDKNINDEEEWSSFQQRFDMIHEQFFKRLKDKYTNLTPQELKLCALLRMNMTTKEMASLMNLSVRGVETSRYRLRKKLELASDVNLVDFIIKFE